MENKVNKASIVFDDCGKCPHCECQRYYTADSFEHEWEYKCLLVEPNKRVSITDKECPIPDWCPILIK